MHADRQANFYFKENYTVFENYINTVKHIKNIIAHMHVVIIQYWMPKEQYSFI